VKVRTMILFSERPFLLPLRLPPLPLPQPQLPEAFSVVMTVRVRMMIRSSLRPLLRRQRLPLPLLLQVEVGSLGKIVRMVTMMGSSAILQTMHPKQVLPRRATSEDCSVILTPTTEEEEEEEAYLTRLIPGKEEKGLVPSRAVCLTKVTTTKQHHKTKTCLCLQSIIFQLISDAYLPVPPANSMKYRRMHSGCPTIQKEIQKMKFPT